jgi:type I restriction enzyme S subunit
VTQHRACLGDVAEFVNGAAFKPEDWGDDGHPIIRIQNLTDPSKSYNRSQRKVNEKLYVKPGDLLVSWSATLGVFEWSLEETGVLNQHIFRVIPNKVKVDKAYLRHALVDALAAMKKHLHGATMLHINRGEFLATPLFLPPLIDQRRIAAILDQADALRAKRREALAQLDSLTQSIFVEMFGDPVTNPKSCAPANLGEVISEMQYGPRFYNEAYSEEGIRIVRITDLDANGNLDFGSMPRMQIDESTNSQFILRPGDIVFARTGATVGKVALINEASPRCIAGAYFIRMQFKESVLPEYAYSVLRAKSVQSIIEKQSRQAAQQNFSGPGLRRLPMPIPPLKLQLEFKDRLKAVQDSIATQKESSEQLSVLFASLQHRAFRGEL